MHLGDHSRRDLEKFAAGVIGLDDAKDSGRSLATLFQKLRDDDFLPDPLAQEALLSLAGRPVGTESLLVEGSSRREECRLHAEIERFAAEFFTSPPDSRVVHWQALVKSCTRRSRLTERLRDLKPGLALDRSQALDPSPIVKRLIDDLLDLFPLAPTARASESRSRLAWVLQESGWTEAERSKAIKHLLRHHAEVAALSQGYLAQLSQSGKPIKLKSVKPQPASSTSVARESRNPRSYVMMAVIVIAALSRLLGANSTRQNNGSVPPGVSPPSVSTNPLLGPSPRPSTNSAGPRAFALPQKGPNLIVRDELKEKIRQEIEKIGKTIDEVELDEIAEALPVDRVPNVGGMATVRLMGYWTLPVHLKFVAVLTERLKQSDLNLTQAEVDALVKKCLPTMTPSSTNRRPSSP